MIGRTFGRYRIVESLGEGGMGTVWKAEDDLLGRSVALKLLSAKLADSVGARARLLREARAAGALDHPGIGTVYDAGEQEGDIFIAMRLVDGGTVADRIRSQGALGLLNAVRIAAGAADALGHAHARGILHRDVSARNLMLTKDGQVVVVDFGLALAEGASRLTQSGTTVGTAYYMAPEIVLGEPPDRRSDMYSLGAVLYEMLTGAPPFEGEHLQTVLYAAVNTTAAPPSARRPGIPPELDRIVLKALSKTPEDRFSSMEALRDELEAMDASGTIPENVAPPTVHPQRRSLAPTTSLDPDAIGRSRSWVILRRMTLIAALVTTVGFTAAGISWLVRRPGLSTPSTYTSVAVLPFKNKSDQPAESDYLSEGLSQALINKLTQLSGVRVLPWITVKRWRESAVSPELLAKDLRVDAVLLGTLRREGDRIRVTVTIVDGNNGVRVAAEEFDEPSADLFAIQNKIATIAAARLLGKLSGKQAEAMAVPAAANLDAYEDYLKGSLALERETAADRKEAERLFRRAIQLDPRFAPAWVGIGAVHTEDYSGVIADEAFQKALEIDPTSIPARRGLIRRYWSRGKSEECLKQGKLVASSGAAGPEATLARAEAYVLGGLPHRALPLLRQLTAEDPANAAALWLLTVGSCWAESFQETVDAGGRYLTEFGDDVTVLTQMADAQHWLGRRPEAEALYRRAFAADPTGSVSPGRLYLSALLRQEGRLDEADSLALETIDAIETWLVRNPGDDRARSILGMAYGTVGDMVRMRQEEARVQRDRGDAALNEFAEFEAILGEKARFVELRKAILHAGNVFCRSLSLPLYLEPDLDDYPGYKEFDAERARECKRLEALY